MAKKDKDDKKKGEGHDEAPVDLAARIGGRNAPDAPPPPPPRKVEDPAPLPPRLDGPLPPRRIVEPRSETPRPLGGGGDQPPRSPTSDPADATGEAEAKSTAVASPRTPPGPGETDLVITPLPTPDDWHRFELALRKVRGVGAVRTEYYRHGVLKVRVSYVGEDRLAQALRVGVVGYRVRVLGEDRTTLQILVSTESDERRPS